MGDSGCKCVHLASSNLPCVPVSFGHGLVYTSSLNPVNITIEIYSMPKLNPPIFRTPFPTNPLVGWLVS